MNSYLHSKGPQVSAYLLYRHHSEWKFKVWDSELIQKIFFVKVNAIQIRSALWVAQMQIGQ